MNKKPKIKLPIIVEGRYDKSAISSIFEANVITTNGFSIFNSKEKQALIKRLGERGGLILLTDSDGGGIQIRSFVSGILPKDKIFHIYTPQIKGKERRKTAPSKAGVLGVEGVGKDVLLRVLSPFIESADKCDNSDKYKEKVTKLDFYNDGFSGGNNSSSLRDALAKALNLPSGMSAKALLQAIDIAVTYEEYKTARDRILKT